MNFVMTSIELSETINFYSAELSATTETMALFDVLCEEYQNLRTLFSADIKRAIKKMKKALKGYDAKYVEQKCFVERATMLLSELELCLKKESALFL